MGKVQLNSAHFRKKSAYISNYLCKKILPTNFWQGKKTKIITLKTAEVTTTTRKKMKTTTIKTAAVTTTRKRQQQKKTHNYVIKN